ncbi:MAG: NAD(P)H-binding protein [Sebaldella sp.]|nr:NAD(P)H-binding protein [Sebaldella sp.]
MKVNIFSGTSDFGKKIALILIDQIGVGNVVLTTRSIEKSKKFSEMGIEIRYADYNDPVSLEKSFKSEEILILIPSISPPFKRVTEFQNALDAAKKNKVKRLILSSIFNITKGVNSTFMMTPFYLYAESSLKLSGLNYTIVRNSWYTEVLLNEKENILEEPAGNGKTSYMGKDEMAKAVAFTALDDKHINKSYTLVSDRLIDYYEIADILSSVKKEQYYYKPMSREKYKEKLISVYGVQEYFSDILISLYDSTAKGQDEIINNDYEKITGEKPMTVENYLKKITLENDGEFNG